MLHNILTWALLPNPFYNCNLDWCRRRHNIQHNNTQQNDIQHKNELNAPLNIMAEYCCTEWRVFCLSLMLSITYKPSMLSGIMLNFVMLSVAMPFRQLKSIS